MKPESQISHSEVSLKDNPFQDPPRSKIEKIKYFFYNLGKYKTSFCRHEGSCMSNCLIGGFKSFYLGFLIRLLINFLALVLFQKKQRTNLVFYIMLLFQKTNFRMGGFIGCYTFLTKSVLCLLRRIRNNDAGINAFISGACAGFFSLFFQTKSSWYLWRVYLWSRAFDIIYQQLIRKKVINDHLWNWGLIMGTFNTLIGYAFLQEPECLPRDVVKLYFKFSHLHENDLIWRAGAMEWKKRLLQTQGIF